MKKILLLLLLAAVYCLPATAQSRTNTLTRPCPAGTTPTRATVSIAVNGSITVTPCSGRTVVTNGVKVYRALLTQTGTDAPTATVLENSLGGTVVWTRSSAGLYLGTLTGAFPAAKTFIISGAGAYLALPADDDVIMTFSRQSDNQVGVFTATGATSVGIDAYLANTPVQILVYP